MIFSPASSVSLVAPMWWRDSAIWNAVFAFVIAAATIAFVLITRRLWIATKSAADATKVAADAAKKSAEIAATLNRPYIGILRVDRTNDQSHPVWVIAWVLKNFGTLPALSVSAVLELRLETSSLLTQDGPSSAEVFPQAEEKILTNLLLSDQDRIDVIHANKTLVAHIRVKYAGSDGHRYLYSAEVHYRCPAGRFAVEKSHTESA